jgi:uncharacterized protein (DUF1330 family)
MIYITQLIYIRDGQEAVFNEFESIAIPLIAKYSGKLLFRLRPSENDFIEHQIEKPDEIHLAQFESDLDFENFKNDKERQQYLHLKEQSIKSTFLIQGSKL